jgi:hypothetical protein
MWGHSRTIQGPSGYLLKVGRTWREELSFSGRLCRSREEIIGMFLPSDGI